MGWNSTLPARGKKTKGWEAARKRLKVRFSAAGIERCEYPGCGSTFAMSFAHRYKRRLITTPEELETCALLCIVHHDQLEKLPHEQMKVEIDKIIAARETPVT